MSSYALEDFEATITHSGVRNVLPVEMIYTVIAAWGSVSGRESELGEWDGGFLLKTHFGFAYIEGWCDYTGWGCQDGVRVCFLLDYHSEPPLHDIPALFTYTNERNWDLHPEDLNIYLKKMQVSIEST